MRPVNILLLLGAILFGAPLPPSLRAQPCAYYPPGGPLDFGLHEISNLNVDSEVGDSPIWLDDGRIAVGAAKSSQGGYRRGAIWIMNPYASGLHDIQSYILPPLPEIRTLLGGFGRTLASSGDWLVTTARLTNDTYTVCLLQATNATGWAFRTNLLADPPSGGEDFGASENSIAMDGPWLAVLRYGMSGRVHLYQVNGEGTWSPRQQVTVPTPQNRELLLSASVVLRDRTLAVGVPQGGTSTYEGAVHVWERDAQGLWQYQTNLAPTDLGSGDRFGASLAIGTNKIFVGATQSDLMTNNSGAIFAFRKVDGQWFESARFAPSNAASTTFVGANLGYSDLNGEWLVDGSQGRIRLFRPFGPNQWSMVAQGHSGRVFRNWESPPATVKTYTYGPTNTAVSSVSVRAHQILAGSGSISMLLEHGWHAIRAFYFQGDPECSVRPVSYQPIGAARDDGYQRMADLDADGIGDIAEIYFGTFGLTNALASGVTPLLDNQTRKIRWPRSTDPQLPISAEPQWSSDLSNWTSDGLTPVKVAEDPATGRDIMEVTLPPDASASAYFRLMLHLPEP